MKQPGARENSPMDPDRITFVGGVPLRRWIHGFRLRRSGEEDEVLSARRPYYFGIVFLALLSIIFQQPLLFISALLLLALVVTPEIWYRYGLRALAVERRPATPRAVFGDTVEVTLSVENRKLLPLPSLEIADDFPEGLPVLGMRLRPSAKPETSVLPNTLALWAYQRVRRRYRIRAVARGAYRFGPMTLRASDPFGILSRETVLEAPSVLLVHPLVAPIERFGLPSHAPFGERKSPRRLLEDPLRVSGIRPYELGDEPRRIHWKATARTGSLQSKVYEPATRHTLAIFLETRTFPRALMGYDPLLVELAITAAASVAMWSLDQRFAVGLYSNGTVAMPEFESERLVATGPASSAAHMSPTPPAQASQRDADPDAASPARRIEQAQAAASLRLRIPPASRPEQATRLLDGLARLLPFYGLPMHEIVTTEAPRLPFGATIVYIGTQAAVDVPLILALRQLRARGHPITLLLTHSDIGGDANPDGELFLAGLPVHSIGGRERWSELEADILGPDVGRKASSVVKRDTHESGMPATPAAAFGVFPDEPATVSDRRASTDRTEQHGAVGSQQHANDWRTSRPLVVE
ncbi:MAG TPA: DUF58 domain-containing protein [Ktedonobacterales bacterium]